MTEQNEQTRKNEERRKQAFQSGDWEFGIKDMMQPLWRHGNNIVSVMAGLPNIMPSMDIVDNGDSFTVKADMPGVDKKNIKLKVTKQGISISAQRSEEKEAAGRGYVYRERSATGYQREVAFPEEVKSDTAKAKYQDGILTVEVRKAMPRSASETEVKIE